MSRSKAELAPYRLNVKLDQDRDADLVSWLESLPAGNRSHAIREALRTGLGQLDQYTVGPSLEAIREVVKEELTRALIFNPVTPIASVAAHPAENVAEAKYGDKLDRMLGRPKRNDSREAG